jgi:hypothetical protein
VPDALQHFIITRLLAAVVRGHGTDERAGSTLGVQARGGAVQRRDQLAKNLGSSSASAMGVKTWSNMLTIG